LELEEEVEKEGEQEGHEEAVTELAKVSVHALAGA